MQQMLERALLSASVSAELRRLFLLHFMQSIKLSHTKLALTSTKPAAMPACSPSAHRMGAHHGRAQLLLSHRVLILYDTSQLPVQWVWHQENNTADRAQRMRAGSRCVWIPTVLAPWCYIILTARAAAKQRRISISGSQMVAKINNNVLKRQTFKRNAGNS